MKPAAPGTGVIAGGAARVILEEAGVHDVLSQVARLGQPHQRRPGHDRTGSSRCSVPTRSPARRGLPPEEFVPKGLLNAYNERNKKPAGRRRCAGRAEGSSSMSEPSHVKQIKSAIGTKPKHRGTLRALGLGKIGNDQHAARPPGDPRHDRPGPAPHRSVRRPPTRKRADHEGPRPRTRTRRRRRAPSASVAVPAARAARPPAAARRASAPATPSPAASKVVRRR